MTAVVGLERLERERETLAKSFAAADPFRYVTIENFHDPDAAHGARRAFPKLATAQRRVARLLEARSYVGEVDRYDPVFTKIFDALGAAPFVTWLREMTGIADLEMDRELVGGGLHQGARGSRLHVHADHNTHPKDPTRYRRVNVLVYVNREWSPDWGGDLDLYDRTGKTAVARIAPAFNRACIMEVHDEAYHGYGALRVPEGETRKLLAAYYYSRTPHPLQHAREHGTTFSHADARSKTAAAFIHLRRALLHRLLPGSAGLVPTAPEPPPNVVRRRPRGLDRTA